MHLRINGMLRHSLATLEGEQDFLFLYRALLSWGYAHLKGRTIPKMCERGYAQNV